MRALILLLFPVLLLASTVCTQEERRLAEDEACLRLICFRIESLYNDDARFLSAFKKSEAAWEKYRDAMLEARFPGEKKMEEYGTVYIVAYAAVRSGLIQARIKELELWVAGTDEGDVSAGSVKLKREIAEIQKRRANQALVPAATFVTPAADAPAWAIEPTPFDALLVQGLSDTQKQAVVEASEDFAAVLAFKKPIHAKADEFGYKDGGSWGYRGRGYTILVWCGFASANHKAKTLLVVYGPDVKFDSNLFTHINAHIVRTAFYEITDLNKKLRAEENQAPVPVAQDPEGKEAAKL